MIFLSFKGNIIWTFSVGPVTSQSVAFISFAKKVAIDFCQFFLSVITDVVLIEFIKKKWGSPCSFKRKGTFYLANELSLREMCLCFVRARVHVRALMTQKSCAVGMRNAKPGNHLKEARKGF